MLKGEVHASYVPYGALALSVFSVDLYFATHQVVAPGGGELIGAMLFMEHLPNWRILMDFMLIAVSGGIYIVPLNAMVQARSEPSHRARNISAVNILNALFMVASAIASALLLSQGFSVSQIFLCLAIFNLGAAYYTYKL